MQIMPKARSTGSTNIDNQDHIHCSLFLLSSLVKKLDFAHTKKMTLSHKKFQLIYKCFIRHSDSRNTYVSQGKLRQQLFLCFHFMVLFRGGPFFFFVWCGLGRRRGRVQNQLALLPSLTTIASKYLPSYT